METAIDRKVNVTVIVANNVQWGMIREQQKAMWGREIGTTARWDYHKIFELQVPSPNQLLTQAISRRRLCGQ